MLLELWWVLPVVAGGAGAAVIGARSGGRRRRRLGFDAARMQLAEARNAAVATTAALKAARAEVAHANAERGAGRASDIDVTRARRALREAEQHAKAASALVRARRARVAASRAELAAPGDPLERLWAAHDALNVRWMEYETDPARAIAFPQMSDVEAPATAAFFAAQLRARDARPAADARRVTPAEFAAYRDAVTELERAFVDAERAAGAVREPRPAWQDTAHQVIELGAEAIRSVTDRTARRREDPR
ncbi:hypothetical protein L2X99_09840 [Microbacterium sp. KUDC0406]|uniref:hypothetical protein n=1 Tax=Microbacterium sp. KUDC0406 TaxID=2909588 RepID=UPI001F394DA3|nr:hypothetical protein [Microbacterium sp. KUDC0406]UJP08810.1 hypothetical protein L2X99_09840 [Microbacterium sp. KUDC0406]